MVIVRRLLLLLVLLLVLVLGLLFALQNSTAVPLDLLAVQLAAQPVANWVLIAFGLGGVIGMALSSLAVVRLRANRSRLRRQLEQREKELALVRGERDEQERKTALAVAS